MRDGEQKETKKKRTKRGKTEMVFVAVADSTNWLAVDFLTISSTMATAATTNETHFGDESTLCRF